MIDKQVSSGITQLTLSPNKSMSWETNKKILFAMFLLNMSIAAGWVYMGAWPVLPFAGLEIALVGLGMYYVSWKLNFKEVLIIDSQSFVLQKGVYFPKQEWTWHKQDIKVIKIPSNYRLSPAQLVVASAEEEIEIGNFLNLEEKKRLVQELTNLHLPIQTVSR